MKKSDTSSAEQKSPDLPEKESFLHRWSQRKLAVSTAIDDVIEENEAEIQRLEVNSVNPESDQTQHELTDEDMPPLESLTEDSDYSAFFSPKVSEVLRQQALRKLFHFEKFNLTDGLNDYDEDYTQFEKLGNIVTHEMKRLLDSESVNLKADQSLDEVTEEKTIAVNTEIENEESNDTLDSDKNSKEDKVTDS